MMQRKKSLQSYIKLDHNSTFGKQTNKDSEVMDYISREGCVHTAWLWGACQGPVS